MFVELLHLVISTRASWLAKYLENISIPLRDPNMQSKAVTSSRDSVVEDHGCQVCIGTQLSCVAAKQTASSLWGPEQAEADLKAAWS